MMILTGSETAAARPAGAAAAGARPAGRLPAPVPPKLPRPPCSFEGPRFTIANSLHDNVAAGLVARSRSARVFQPAAAAARV